MVIAALTAMSMAMVLLILGMVDGKDAECRVGSFVWTAQPQGNVRFRGLRWIAIFSLFVGTVSPITWPRWSNGTTIRKAQSSAGPTTKGWSQSPSSCIRRSHPHLVTLRPLQPNVVASRLIHRAAFSAISHVALCAFVFPPLSGTT